MRPITLPSIRLRRTIATTVAIVAVVLSVPTVAHAACNATQRADSRAAALVVRDMRTAGAPGTRDVAAVYARARRSCADLRFARAVASATSRLGVPRIGERALVHGIDLVGTGALTWRLDTVRLALRVATTRSSATAAILRRELRASGFGAAAITWSDDSTVRAFDADRQSGVAAALARSGRSSDRLLAGVSVRAFGPRRLQLALQRRPLLEHLRIANRLALAADLSRSSLARTTARSVALRAHVRVRGSRARGWSRIDGAWSTGSQHRLLVGQARALVRRVPHETTAAAVAALRAASTSDPAIDFQTLPSGEFYPFPRDGAFDSQSLTFDVDKPVDLTFIIYGEDDRPVRTTEQQVLPGIASFGWNGADDHGTILGPGDYRYVIAAVDPLRNAVRIPGLEQFRIARDTTAPRVETANARYVATGQRRVIASWNVHEVHSPAVRSTLLLRRGATTRTLQLHGSLQQATVRKPQVLGRGTWTVTFVFVDGSGNRTQRSAGSIVVR